MLSTRSPMANKVPVNSLIKRCQTDKSFVQKKKSMLFRRLLEPNYDDGVGRPKSVSVVDKWTSLPNPRKISTVVHSGPG